MNVSQTVYLDYQAATPLDPQVLAAMAASFSEDVANPHSSDHILGWRANATVEAAAAGIVAAVGADADEIIFCSGATEATEANNLAVVGIAGRAPLTRRRILVSATEHKSVFGAATAARNLYNCIIEVIPVTRDGFVDLNYIAERLHDDVILVSVMAVNNEIGTIQPLKEIIQIARRVGALVHSDAAQALTGIDVDLRKLDLDLLSLSAHKLYGPKGIGALIIRRHLHDAIEPIIHGGGQQYGIRAGTLPAPLCVGFQKAIEVIGLMAQRGERVRVARLRNRLMRGLCALGNFVKVNGAIGAARHPGNLNVRFEGFDGRDLLSAAQPYLAASTGEACTSGVPEPSHVLRAIGLNNANAEASLRFGVGRFNTHEQIDCALEVMAQVITESALEQGDASKLPIAAFARNRPGRAH